MFSILKKIMNSSEDDENKQVNEFLLPVSGKVISLESVEDEVFSKKMMGDGFAIEPINGQVFSPIDGLVTCAFVTKHAISIRQEQSEMEILIHFGLDSVELKGDGFEMYVKEGEHVKAGDKILEVDLEKLKQNGIPTVVPIVFINNGDTKFTYATGDFNAKESGIVKCYKA